MSRLWLAAAAVLMSFGASAQVADMAPTCLPNTSTQSGMVDGVGWATWQCRAPAPENRYWYRFFVFVDTTNPPAGVGAVFDKARAGDLSALSVGAALRSAPITAPRFALAKKAADVAASNQKPLAVRVDNVTGEACACDIAHTELGGLWACPS